MRAMNRWVSDEEIEVSKEQARRGGVGRKHHHVPEMYLKRWAVGGKVQLTVVATGATYPQNPSDIAREVNLYRIAASDVDRELPALWFEKHTSRIESEAASWFRTLDQHPDGRVTSDRLIDDMAVFVSLQSQRTLKRRQGELNLDEALDRFGRREVLSSMLPIVCAVKRIPYEPWRHEEQVEEFLKVPLISSEAKPRAIESSIGVWKNDAYLHFRDERSWWLFSTDDPIATCDEPVVFLGGPERDRSRPPSWMQSPIVVYPIAPHRVLVLARRSKVLPGPFVLSAAEAHQVNYEIAGGSLEFMYERPGDGIAASVSVPPHPHFDPMQAGSFAEVVSPPQRWASGEGPDWAVSRWYR
ncbi:DUF4238 domain-containing protein [Rhodococcus zopfii]|uniref:DUF4238 domain-containing protein n=1 Tax=Rhodococcus zopfii TaxID=43772 RepID=UPI0035289167